MTAPRTTKGRPRWRAWFASAVVAGSLLAGLPAGTLAATQTLASGNGVIGGTDALVESSMDGVTWQPADLPVPNGVYSIIPGTQWVSRTTAPSGSAVFYRIAFTLPAGFFDPQLTVLVHADNWAQVSLNGVAFGAQPAGDHRPNFQGAPESFSTTASFVSGTNVLSFRVQDIRAPHGLDFQATVAYGSNREPIADAGGPYAVDEGSSVTLAGTGQDPDGDALAFTWDLDGDGLFETAGASPSFSAAALDGPSVVAITLRTCDPDGACATDAATVAVANVAPAATFVAPATAPDGSLVLALAGASDPSAADTTAGFTYRFDCGDGSGPSAFGGASSATCPAGPLGPRTVAGAVRDRDGATTEFTAPVIVYGATGTGRFVVGDGSASGDVTFWSAGWAKANVLSGGAPPAFKGFAGVVAACGTRWAAAQGGSANPPATLPEYIAVIVSSAVTKKGASISGDVTSVVVVRTSPGYGPTPEQPGTGTVVATIC